MMANWTRETEQALEEYLVEVGRLARDSGEDDAEIVSDLREHVVTEAEASAGNLVTLDVLQKVLRAVGNPEVVIGLEDNGEKQLKCKPARTEAPPKLAAAPIANGTERPQKFLILGKGCMFWSIGLALLFPLSMIVLAVLGGIVAVVAPSLSRARQVASWQAQEQKATVVLEAIAEDQARFRDSKISDLDGDGIADYGTLGQLLAMENSAVGAVLPDADKVQGLSYHLETTPSGNDGVPHFTCEAVPEEAEPPFLTWTVDESGEIQSHKH